MHMNDERWQFTSAYLREVFGRCDAHLDGLMARAVAAGLPDIAVSADVGRLLKLLTSMTRGRLAVELGTLAGYSAIWLARGLQPDGRLITLEREPHHARFAEGELATAGLAARVSVRVGAALDLLPDLVVELGPGSVDVLFFDAVKTEYPDYWRACRALLAPGGLLLADNVLGSGGWWIDDTSNPARAGADALNRAVAGDRDMEAVAVPLREGLLIARRVR